MMIYAPIGGKIHSSYKAACIAMELLEIDMHWDETIIMNVIRIIRRIVFFVLRIALSAGFFLSFFLEH